jgi:hypothetical protein
MKSVVTVKMRLSVACLLLNVMQILMVLMVLIDKIKHVSFITGPMDDILHKVLC